MRNYALTVALIALACLASPAEAAEDYPCHDTVRIIVPFGASAASSIQARIVADHLARRYNRTFIVESKPGAEGAIGAWYASIQPGDGCALFWETNGLFGVELMSGGKIQMPKLGEFVPITKVAQNTLFLVVAADNPVTTVQGLIASARTKDMTYGTSNTSGYVSGALFATLAKAPLRRIPYKVEGDMVTNLMSGFVSSAFSLAAFGHVQGGKLRALAVMSDRRFARLPDVPAICEVFPKSCADILLIAPHGTLAGPRGFPRELAERLSHEICDIVKQSDVLEKFRNLGSEPVCSTPDGLAAYYGQQTKDWSRIVGQYKLETSAQ